MPLISRVSRLFQADLHAVLDRVEEPDSLLRQAVREMEEALARGERRYRVLELETGRVSARRQDLEKSLADLDEQLDLCFESGKDDLARSLVRRKLEVRGLLKVLARRQTEVETDRAGLGARLEEDRARLEATRQKVELLREGPGAAQGDWELPEVSVRNEDVEVAFLREKNRRARP